MNRLLALPLLIVAIPAQAQLCDGSNTRIGGDGRALGHLPYGDAPPAELAGVAPGLSVNACAMRREVLPDLERLLAAGGGGILALSCHRSIARQQAVFCRETQTSAGDRAISVAPPGHSEHATGYALDFAFRPRVNGCPDAEACVAATGAFRWLAANAPLYGFEMSFPASNRQRVKWEPWHWRWVGVNGQAPGAARARALFAKARRAFPASPGVAPDVPVVRDVPAPPVWMGAMTPPECRKGKCRVARVRR